MSETVPDYRLKIERAKRHIRELSEEVQAFNASKPYEAFADDNTKPGQRIWKVKVKKKPPQAWSGIVGDVIHNARAALDLLAVAVVRHDDPGRVNYNHVYFVIRETKHEFETALGKRNLKPYKGGDETFWRLHQLDILDKHKAIIPVGAAHTATNIPMTFGPPGFPAPKFTLNISRDRKRLEFPLEDGATLCEVPLDSKGPFNQPPQFTATLAFGEGPDCRR